MSMMNAGDILWFMGALVAAGFCAYGGWLSITAPEGDRGNVTGDARTSGARPEAKVLPPRLRATVRARHLGTRRSYEDAGVKGV